MIFKLQIKPDAEEFLAVSVHQNGDIVQKARELVEDYNGEGKLTAYTEDDMKLLSPGDIECVTVSENKTYAHTTSGESFLLKKRLYELEQTLPSGFIKINKSCIGNKKHIERFSAAFSGAVNVIFKSGYTDYVSRRCYAQIKKELKAK